MSESSRPLTAKRKLFVDHYLIHGNATQAAIAAGYSKASAASIGSELLAMPNVRAAIEARQAERAAQLRVTAHRAFEELSRLAFFDTADFVHQGPDGALRFDFSKLTREQAAAIANVTIDGSAKVRLRLDKRAALV